MNELLKNKIAELETARNTMNRELFHQIEDNKNSYRESVKDLLTQIGLDGLVRHTRSGKLGWIKVNGEIGNYLKFYKRTARGDISTYPDHDIFPVDVTEFEPVEEI